MLCFAYKLCHSSHGTIHTPGTGLKQNHGYEAQHGGGKHDTVKAEGELGGAVRKKGAVISPVPGKLKGPQKGYSHTKIPCPGKNQIRVPQHLKEHDKEENQKSISEIT